MESLIPYIPSRFMDFTQIPSVADPLIPNFLRISTVGTPLRYGQTASICISFENIRKPHELDLLQLMGFSSFTFN